MNDDYYLLISFEIAKMLIQSHRSIRKHFKGATKKNGLKSNNDNPDRYYEKKLNQYLLNAEMFNKKINIVRMNFVGKSRYGVMNKSQPICPAKTIDDYRFKIFGDPSLIFNGNYCRCLSLSDTAISDNGEVSFVSNQKYKTIHFDKRRLHIWVHETDMISINNNSINSIESKIPNKDFKYVRCLTRDSYNSTHCYWRLHCLKINNHGKISPYLQKIGENKLDENHVDCIQYLGVVHNWRSRNGGHSSSKEKLPQYYEYPCGRHTVWRRVEGISFVQAQMALCYNEFCTTLPQLNNLGTNSNTIKCQLIQSQSKILWNNKFIKNVEKNINSKNVKNESKLIYYYTFIWLNQLIYKTALDHGFNFKKINKMFVAPHFYYKQNWNPLARHLQKYLFKGRIKFYGKEIYFKQIHSSSSSSSNNSNNNKDSIKIGDSNDITDIVNNLLKCLRTKLQNNNNNCFNDKEWYLRLNNIKLSPNYIIKNK